MEEHWKRNIKIFLAFLIAGTIVFCLFPTVRAVSSQLAAHFFPERTLTVTVVSAGKGGGTEMWLSAPKGSRSLEGMQAIPSGARYSGICEYRKAEEHGYACDFLVSYGDNVGSTFEIPYVLMADSGLQIWCCLSGAILEIRDGDKEPVYYDTYSETGKLETIGLRYARLNRVFVWLITLFLLCALVFILYVAQSGGGELYVSTTKKKQH